MKFSGIIAPLITPFDGDEQVDHAAIDALVIRLLDRGIDGLFVCGGTGEWWALTEPERVAITERVIDLARGKVPVMVHVGASATGSAVRLARHAEQVGADAISALPPTGFSFSPDSVWAHFRAIADACNLPLYLYHFPQVYGDAIGIDRFIDATESMPTLAGVKFSSYRIDDLIHLHNQTRGRLNILSGCSEQLLSAMTCGAEGSICTWYNLLPRLAQQILKDLRAGELDAARAHQETLVVIAKFCGNKHLANCKSLITQCGVPVGIPRRPLPQMQSGEDEALAAGLKQRGVWDWLL